MTDEQLHALIGRMTLEIEALRLALVAAQNTTDAKGGDNGAV